MPVTVALTNPVTNDFRVKPILTAFSWRDCYRFAFVALPFTIWKLRLLERHSINKQTEEKKAYNLHIITCLKTKDYQGKRVNPPYRPSTQGNLSLVIFIHGTQFFRGCYSRVAWMFSWSKVQADARCSSSKMQFKQQRQQRQRQRQLKKTT